MPAGRGVEERREGVETFARFDPLVVEQIVVTSHQPIQGRALPWCLHLVR